MKKYAKEWEETGPFLFLPFFSRLALLFTNLSQQTESLEQATASVRKGL